jgi:hypothetical protein
MFFLYKLKPEILVIVVILGNNIFFLLTVISMMGVANDLGSLATKYNSSVAMLAFIFIYIGFIYCISIY